MTNRRTKNDDEAEAPRLGVQAVKITPRKRPYDVAGRGALSVKLSRGEELDRLGRGDPPEHCAVHDFDYYGIFVLDGRPVCPKCASDAVLDGRVLPVPEGPNLTGLSRRIAWLVHHAELTNDEANAYQRVAGACEAVYAAETQQAWLRLAELLEQERAELGERLSIPVLVLPAELAAVLRCSVRTIERRAAQRQIPGAIRVVPKSLAFRADVLDAWLRRVIGTEDPVARFRRLEQQAANRDEALARGEQRQANAMNPSYDPVVVAMP